MLPLSSTPAASTAPLPSQQQPSQHQQQQQPPRPPANLQSQPTSQKVPSTRRFSELLDALKTEYESALSTLAAPPASLAPAASIPDYSAELALMQKTVRELEQSHLRGKAGWEEEVKRLQGALRAHGLLPEMDDRAAAQETAADNPPAIETTAGILTSSFGAGTVIASTPPTAPITAATTAAATASQTAVGIAGDPARKPSSPAAKPNGGWLSLYANPSAPRAVSIDLLQSLAADNVVCSVAFSPLTRAFLAVGLNRAVHVYEVRTGRRLLVLADTTATDSAASAASGAATITTAAAAATASSPDTYMRSVAWSPDEQLVAAGAEDHYVRVWSVALAADPCAASSKLKHRLAGHAQDVYAIAFHPSGKLIVSAGGDRTVRLWDAASGTCRACLHPKTSDLMLGTKNDVGFTSVAVSDTLIIAGSLDRRIWVWQRHQHPEGSTEEEYVCRGGLEGHGDAVYAVTLSPSLMIASASLDRTLRLWLPASPADPSSPLFHLAATFSDHKDYCLSVALSPDQCWLVSGSKDRNILVYRLSADGDGTVNGELQLTLQGHRNSVISMALMAPAAGHMVLASGSGDCRVRLWSLTTAAAV